jgi:hypothetical protein
MLQILGLQVTQRVIVPSSRRRSGYGLTSTACYARWGLKERLQWQAAASDDGEVVLVLSGYQPNLIEVFHKRLPWT